MIGIEIENAVRDLESKGFEFAASELKSDKLYISTLTKEDFLKVFHSYDRNLTPKSLVRVFDKVQNFNRYEVKSVYGAYECLLVKEVIPYQ